MADYRLPPELQRLNYPVSPSKILPCQIGTREAAAASSSSAPAISKPAVLHRPHPDSKLCQNFHWVPYPLGLMPYDSWHRLHYRDSVIPLLPFRCPVCKVERKLATHTRKLFLVAERLSCDDKLVSMNDKDLNEELNWKVNYELGILDPFVEDPEQIPGGKHSRANKFYPYKNELEMKLALKLIIMAEEITETSWALWIGTQMDIQNAMEPEENKSIEATSSAKVSKPARDVAPEAVESIDLTSSPDPASDPTTRSLHGLPTPPSSSSLANEDLHKLPVYHGLPTAAAPDSPRLQRIESYKTLQDFYSLLDKIERTSYVGALFLEAYAEKLRDDLCKKCWFKHNVNLDLY